MLIKEFFIVLVLGLVKKIEIKTEIVNIKTHSKLRKHQRKI